MTDASPENIKLFLIHNTIFALIFLALALITSWVAYIRGFYSLPHKNLKGPEVTIYDVLFSFGTFVIVYALVAPLLWQFFLNTLHLDQNKPLFITLLQLAIFMIVTLFLAVYALFRDRVTMGKIWKDRSFPAPKKPLNDLILAWITLVIAAPIVLVVAHVAEVLRVLIFGYSPIEQLAIRYLKLALESPISASLAFLSILIFAPFLEEYLFRGILQSWFRGKLGPVKAIFVTAICFGAFHFSTTQSSTNIPLIITLIAFACYLGFLYEKTRSLFAPIFLHVTFNCISVIRIIFNEL